MCRGQQRAPHTRGHGKRRSIFTTVPAVSTRGVAISACLALRAYSDATHRILVHHLPVYRPPLPHTLVSDCTVPRRYVVHSGYAYPSALLWADLLINKVGPYQYLFSQNLAGDRVLKRARLADENRTSPGRRMPRHRRLSAGRRPAVGTCPPARIDRGLQSRPPRSHSIGGVFPRGRQILASADLHPLKVACSVLPGAVLRSASDPCRQQALGPQNPHASGRSAPIAGGCSAFLRPAQQYEPQGRAAAARARLAHRCCSCTPTLVLILSRGAAGSGRG